MRIGIFGGTFDPPHLGHVKFANEFIDRLELDRLIVIPTFIPPHKATNDAACSEDRMKMSELLFASIDKTIVSDMEIKRKGKSYTYDTVKELAEMYPDDELFFLLGSDMLISFHKWWKPEEIIRYVKICAVSRSDSITEQNMTDYVKKYFPNDTNRFIICEFSPIEISSTDIRNAIKCGRNTDGMLSPHVMKYIKEKELYL